MRRFSLLAVLLLATTMAWAKTDWMPAAEFTWPEEPVRIVMRGRDIDCVWRDGKPFARREHIAGAIELEASSDVYVDLVEALAAGEHQVRLFAGAIEINAAQNVSSSGSRGKKRQSRRGQRYTKKIPNAKSTTLGYRVEEFVADDTDHIRAWVVVMNEGSAVSSPTWVNCYFTDQFDKPFAVDKTPIGELQPGESVRLQFFSGMFAKDAPVINYKATVRFGAIDGVKSNIKQKSRLERLKDEDKSKKTWSLPSGR